MPRAAMSHTCAPSISSQTRTQREHRTQRLWSSTKRGMRGVDRQARIVVGEADVGDAELLRQCLQFAMTVRDADGADMVAFDEQQLQRHHAMMGEILGFGGDRHAAVDGRRAGGQQPPDARHLDQAQPAGARRAQAFHVAERRNVASVGAGHVVDRLTLGSGAELTVDAHRDLLGHGRISLPVCDGVGGFADVAPQAAARLLVRLFRLQGRGGLLERLGADRRRQARARGGGDRGWFRSAPPGRNRSSA